LQRKYESDNEKRRPELNATNAMLQADKEQKILLELQLYVNIMKNRQHDAQLSA